MIGNAAPLTNQRSLPTAIRSARACWRAWDRGALAALLRLHLIFWPIMALLVAAWPGGRAIEPTTFVNLLLGAFWLQWLGATLGFRLHTWLATPAGARVVTLISAQRLLQPPARVVIAPRRAPVTVSVCPSRRRVSRRLPFALFGYAPLLTAP